MTTKTRWEGISAGEGKMIWELVENRKILTALAEADDEGR
jgi:hypothetical protein